MTRYIKKGCPFQWLLERIRAVVTANLLVVFLRSSDGALVAGLLLRFVDYSVGVVQGFGEFQFAVVLNLAVLLAEIPICDLMSFLMVIAGDGVRSFGRYCRKFLFASIVSADAVFNVDGAVVSDLSRYSWCHRMFLTLLALGSHCLFRSSAAVDAAIAQTKRDECYVKCP